MLKLEKLREDVRRYGLGSAIGHGAYALAARAVGFKALRGMTLRVEDIDPKYLGETAPFSCHRATAAEFAKLPGAAELATSEFYEGAAQRGDWCYYLRDGETIASNGWYSTGVVPLFDDTFVSFSPNFVYMYKGFTLPEHRGHQLHAYGMAHAAAGAVAEGYQGLISCVEIHNAGSLRSVARLGYRSFGTCYRTHVLGKTLTFSSRGCEPYGFRLVVPDAPRLEAKGRAHLSPSGTSSGASAS
jgi:hypothetical protein